MPGEIATATLPPPTPDQACTDVSALETGNINLPIDRVVADTELGTVSCPSLAFLLRYSKTSFQIVFDLGTRRDLEGYPPVARERIETLGSSPMVKQNVAESLEKGGALPDEHRGSHPVHKGDVYRGCWELLANGYPENPDAAFSSTSIPVERARFISKSDLTTSIGPYSHALDVFGDGSLYIVDASGHVAGHINVLARTSANGSWILLGGDSAHDWRIVTGEKAFACVEDPATGHVHCILHADKDVAAENLKQVRALLQVPKVQVLIAHDVPWYEANKGGPAFLPRVIPALV